MTKIAGQNRINGSYNLQEALDRNEILAESYAAATAAIMSMRADEEGWLPLNKLKDDGFTLKNLQDIAEQAELQTTGNPLLKRGLTLRTEYVFGRGVGFENKVNNGTIPPRFQDIMDKPGNCSVLFSEEAFERNEREVFNKGNLFMAYRKSSKTFFPIPFAEITNSASNPDLQQDVWYYQRTYIKTKIDGTPEDEPTIVWYPVLEKAEEGVARLRATIADNRVDKDVVIIDAKFNTHIGGVWGVPDVLPALPYAWAHAEYIRDASKLLKALSTIAWKVVSKSKNNAANASVKMGMPKAAGSTASMTDNTDLVAMPRSGQVDMTDGQELAGYVASALQVSLVAITSNPGAASGSYGAAASLDQPSANSARARQAMWASFYKRIYRAVGMKDVVVNFPKITEDPIFRQMQSFTLAFVSGGIHQDEYRVAALEALDVKSLHEEVPEATVFTAAAKYSLEAIEQEEKAAQDEADRAAALSKQGAAGLAGAGGSGTNDLRDLDATPGTGSA